GLLPYETDYTAYTVPHVVNQAQLLLLSSLAFAVLLRTGLYPRALPSVNLDADVLYRRLLPRLWRTGVRTAARLRDAAAPLRRRAAGVAATATRPVQARGRLGAAWSTDVMVLWVALLLGLVLLLSLLWPGRADREHRGQAGEQDQRDPGHARPLRPEHGDEPAEGQRPEEADGASRRRVEPERLALPLGRDDAGEKSPAGRLGGPDERREEQPARPERGLARQHHQRAARQDQPCRRGDDHALGPETVVQPPAEHRPGPGGEVRRDREDHHLGGAEPERARRDHPAEREDRREPVPVDGAGHEEQQRAPVGAPHVPQPPGQHDVPGEKAPSRGLPGRRRLRDEQQHRQREQGEPQRREQRDRADVEAVLRRHPEQPHVGLHEREQHDRQRDQPAEVAHPPAEARDPPDRRPRRHLHEHRVVADLRDLEEHAARRDQP